MASDPFTNGPNRLDPGVMRTADSLHDVRQTDCCIVGGGPAGTVLALLLARKGISVMLLEMHKNFDRDFRGDTIHPSVMEILSEIGLADRLLQLRHTKLPRISMKTAAGSVTIADFSRLKTRYPYITLLPQVRFLEFIAEEAKRYPTFQLLMSANVQELIEEDGVVRGVRYLRGEGMHELRAMLTVGTDGRFSRTRRLAGMKPIKTAPPMDVLWFRLPRKPEDPKDAGVLFHLGRGHFLILLDRSEEGDWQVGYVIPKGSYQQLRAAGLGALRQSIVELVPEFTNRVEYFKDWTQASVLSVESSRLPRWWQPGLLLIGDAAHVMSPVGAVGINYAIQDAVAAANVLAGPLQTGRLKVSDLAEVQRQREWPTRITDHPEVSGPDATADCRQGPRPEQAIQAAVFPSPPAPARPPCPADSFRCPAGSRKKLDQTLLRGAFALAFLKVATAMDTLRSDPRFQDLLRRMNFAEPEPPCLLGGDRKPRSPT